MSTIKDIAAKAGVSIATVSYVFNGRRKVSSATEQRVRAVAQKLGYTPNIAARSLALRQNQIVGLVVPDIRNPFFPEVTAAFQEAAHMSNMDAIVLNSPFDPERIRSTFSRLLALQVPGAALLSSAVGHALKAELAGKDVCAVYLDHGEPGRNISSIAINYRQGIFEAVEHLRRLGHRRIGFIGGPRELDSAQRRHDAFLEAAGQCRELETSTINSDFSVQGGYFSCSKLVASFAPTAILAANDLMAIGAMHSIYDRGLRIPADISVLGWDDILFAQFTQPALSTVCVPRSEIGRIAFQALLALISGPGHKGQSYEVTPSLVVRQSTGVRPSP